jgi:recombination protein RecR
MNNAGIMETLIRTLGGLPGLGNRSARRIALHLLNNRESLMRPLSETIARAADEIKTCHSCGNLDVVQPCRICEDARRDQTSICVLAHVSDLWAVERTGSYRGGYHVLGGVLSALDGIGPQDLRIDSLIERVRRDEVTEVILALSATVDGQSTAHYISDRLDGIEGLNITRIAHGMPVGGELDYLDDGTITTALKARKSA